MNRSSLRTLIPALAATLLLALPAAASALTFDIDNQSGRPPSEVFVTVTGGDFEVGGMTPDVSKPLSEIAGEQLDIAKLSNGRIYISYGAAISEASLPFNGSPRFDWVELNVGTGSSDVANLTAVDQFGIGMRLETFGAGKSLEALGSANSNTIFAALQQIPGAPQATVRGAGGEIVRVISPNKSGVYPDLGEYVRSMSGKAVTLHTAFFGTPFTTSTYSGTFGPDGSIVLNGATNPPGGAPASIPISGADLIGDIYTGGGTEANDLQSAIYRDLMAGFSAGYWDGRYGNDALSFCTQTETTAAGTWCPHFNQPAFGAAKLSLAPFPTCEQFSAVIDQYSDAYGNPYSDDIGKPVQIGVTEAEGVAVETLRLTIQPDSGNAQPVHPGNSNCGAGAPAAAPVASTATAETKTKTKTTTKVKVRFLAKAKVRGRVAKVGRLVCSGPCGRVKAVAKKGKLIVARKNGRLAKTSGPLKLRLTKKGKARLKRAHSLKVKVIVWVTPAGQKPVRKLHKVKLVN